MDEKTSIIAGLREFADWLEAHPTASLPTDTPNIIEYVPTRDEMVVRARELGGQWAKSTDDAYFNLMRRFGPFRYCIFTNRSNVCERVVIGTKEVVREEPAPEAIAALPKVRTVETVEDVEWWCPDVLLGTDEDAEADRENMELEDQLEDLSVQGRR